MYTKKLVKIIFFVLVIIAKLIIDYHTKGIYLITPQKALDNVNNAVLIYSKDSLSHQTYYYVLYPDRTLDCFTGIKINGEEGFDEMDSNFLYIYEGKRKKISKDKYNEIIDLADKIHNNLFDITPEGYVNKDVKSYLYYKQKKYDWETFKSELERKKENLKLQDSLSVINGTVENLFAIISDECSIKLKSHESYFVKWRGDNGKYKLTMK